MILYRRKRRGKMKVITCSSGSDGIKYASFCCGGWKAWGYATGSPAARGIAQAGCCDCSGWYIETSAACGEGPYRTDDEGNVTGVPLYCDVQEIDFRFYLMAWGDDNAPGGCASPNCTEKQIAEGKTDEWCTEQTKLQKVGVSDIDIKYAIKWDEKGVPTDWGTKSVSSPLYDYAGGDTGADFPDRGCADLGSGMTIVLTITSPDEQQDGTIGEPKVEWSVK